MSKTVNDILAFLLELVMFFVYGYWGFQHANTLLSKWVLALTCVVTAAILWGIWAAPKSAQRLEFYPRMVFELAVLLGAAFLTHRLGNTKLAIAFSIAIMVNKAVQFLFRQ